MDERTPQGETDDGSPAGDDGPEAPTTEYAANREPGRNPDEGYVGGGNQTEAEAPRRIDGR